MVVVVVAAVVIVVLVVTVVVVVVVVVVTTQSCKFKDKLNTAEHIRDTANSDTVLTCLSVRTYYL